MNAAPNLQSTEFDWPLADEAETLLRNFVKRFLVRNRSADDFAECLARETGTDFFEWVDHLTLDPEHVSRLSAVGLETEKVSAPPGTRVFFHPRAMLPRVLILEQGSDDDTPR
jgi:hypothetical protein